MPKMQVYLPHDLYRDVKSFGAAINVSAVLQAALTEHLAALERSRAVAEAIAHYEAEFGMITDDEVARQSADDRANAVQPKAKKKRRSAA